MLWAESMRENEKQSASIDFSFPSEEAATAFIFLISSRTESKTNFSGLRFSGGSLESKSQFSRNTVISSIFSSVKSFESELFKIHFSSSSTASINLQRESFEAESIVS